MSNIYRSFNPIGSQPFTSSGSSIVPPSVNRIILLGAGGGQGGQGGGITNAGPGGIGVTPQELILAVTSGQSWSVVIGGGSAGTAGLTTAGPNSAAGTGGNSTFTLGGVVYTFFGSGVTVNVFSPLLITTASNVSSLYATPGSALGGAGGGGGYQAGGNGSANGVVGPGNVGGLSAGGGGGGQHTGTGNDGGAGGSGFILVTW
jgi:hypothetical protein